MPRNEAPQTCPGGGPRLRHRRSVRWGRAGSRRREQRGERCPHCRTAPSDELPLPAFVLFFPAATADWREQELPCRGCCGWSRPYAAIGGRRNRSSARRSDAPVPGCGHCSWLPLQALHSCRVHSRTVPIDFRRVSETVPFQVLPPHCGAAPRAAERRVPLCRTPYRDQSTTVRESCGTRTAFPCIRKPRTARMPRAATRRR